MPSADKANLKAAAMADLLTDLDASIAAAMGNRTAMRAGAEAMKRLLERFKGYRDSIDAALDDGTFPPDSRDPVLAVFNDLSRMTDQLQQQLRKAHDEQGPFVQGLHKARALAEARRRAEVNAAQLAEREEHDEDEYRADVAERTAPPALPVQGNGNTPDGDSLDTDPQDTPQDAPQGAPLADTGDDTPDTPDAPAGAPQEDDSPAPVVAACSHCSGTDAQLAEDGVCLPCTTHRNRYGKLPSDRALAKRRGRDGANP